MIDISVEKPIAQGRTADVYLWDDAHILKLFHGWFDLESIQYELRISRAVHANGVKSPAVSELVQVEGRNGLIYERVMGESMLRMFQRRPWKVLTYSHILARLHAKMHESIFNTDVPNQHERLQHKIQYADALPSSTQASLLAALNSLPEGDHVCHGDFHPNNVLLSGNDATVIDWIDASRGNPLADVARTSVILRGAIRSKQIPDPISRIFVGLFHSSYLQRYFRLRPEGWDEYQRWLPVVAGARLSEGIPEIERWLVDQAKNV
jgi:uncharacterized protein (TIGR02172 family)